MTSARLNFTNDYVFFTVQGEGKLMGVPSVFVRLSGCNLRCAWQNPDGTTTLCDTWYSSHKPERNPQTIDDTVKLIGEVGRHARHVVVTGGEPMMQEGYADLIATIKVKLDYHVTVETNGTYMPPGRADKLQLGTYRQEARADLLSISPKLSTSQGTSGAQALKHHADRVNFDVLSKLVMLDHQLKFVVNTEDDVTEAQSIVDTLRQMNGYYDGSNVYLMPQGTSAAQLDQRAPWIIEKCKERGWNYSDRIHVRIWGDRRGV